MRLLMLLVFLLTALSPARADRVFYLAAEGPTEFHDALVLSDGSLLISGQASNLD